MLARGSIRMVQLSAHMLAGRDLWLRWHQRFGSVLSPRVEQARNPLPKPVPLLRTLSCNVFFTLLPFKLHSAAGRDRSSCRGCSAEDTSGLQDSSADMAPCVVCCPLQEDLATLVAVSRANQNAVQVVRLQQPQPSLALHDAVCSSGEDNGQSEPAGPPLLLLPPGFELLDEAEAAGQLSELLMVRPWSAAIPAGAALMSCTVHMMKMCACMPHSECVVVAQIGAARGSGIGALTFGVQLPGGQVIPSYPFLRILQTCRRLPLCSTSSSSAASRAYAADSRDSKAGGGACSGAQVSFPTGPTWLLYDGDDAHCAESIPLLLARRTFCDAFVAHARVFRTYQSWVLTMMLRQVCWGVACALLLDLWSKHSMPHALAEKGHSLPECAGAAFVLHAIPCACDVTSG